MKIVEGSKPAKKVKVESKFLKKYYEDALDRKEDGWFYRARNLQKYKYQS